MSTIRFVKERGEGAQVLSETEVRYKQLLGSVTDYVYTVTVKDGRPAGTSHGPGCEAVTGYTSREFGADPYLWYRMVYDQDRSAVTERADQILRGETPPPLEHRIVRKDGSIRWIRNTAVPHKDEMGRLMEYDGLVSDITERKEAELALRESQERLALVIQGSRDGIWDWNLLTNEVYYSPRWKSMLGYSDQEVENHFSAWLRLLHPDDWDLSLERIHQYLSGQTPNYELECRLRHKDGSYRWILARGVALRNGAGKPTRMAGSHVDLTDRKQVEEKLRNTCVELSRNQIELRKALEDLGTSHKQLQAAQLHLIQAAKMESVGTLAAGVAHEVKNPLQTILMGLDYLDSPNTAPDANTRTVLNDMRDAVRRANLIIRELLHFSSKRDFEMDKGNINEVIENSLRLMNKELLDSQILVTRKLAPDLSPVKIDTTKMQQVFLNLFINAVQAMPKGGNLTVATRADQFNGDLHGVGSGCPHFRMGDQVVVVEVRDTGTGITEADLPRVFDPFFTTKAVGGGSGLGLSVVKNIVDRHCGAIALRNAPVQGAIATLILKPEPGNA